MIDYIILNSDLTMPTQEKEPGYLCPYCSEYYKDYDDAVECSKECLINDIDKPIEYEGSRRCYCDYCNKTHHNYQDAEKCEKTHEKNKDMYYEKVYQVKQYLKLIKLGNHKNQTKLNIFMKND